LSLDSRQSCKDSLHFLRPTLPCKLSHNGLVELGCDSWCLAMKIAILAFAAGIPPCMYGNRPLTTLLHGYLLAGTSNISKSLFNQSKGSISRCAVRH
jgi:hypothetical protein